VLQLVNFNAFLANIICIALTALLASQPSALAASLLAILLNLPLVNPNLRWLS
jgi:hypothetical protein